MLNVLFSEIKSINRDKFLGVIWIFGLIILFIYLNQYMSYAIDSDDASELVLAQQLAKDCNLFSADWYYSTELRVINTQLVYAILFKFFDSWHIIRLIGNLLIVSIFILSMFFLNKSGKFHEYFNLTMILFFLPIVWHDSSILWRTSGFQYKMFFVGAFYIPHLVFTCLLLGLYYRYIVKGEYIFLISGMVLSFLASLEGIREFYIFHIPLLLGFVMEYVYDKWNLESDNQDTKKLRYKLKFLLLTGMVALIAVVINAKFLSAIFTFKHYNNIIFSKFSLEKLSNIINGYLSNLGYQAGKNIFSIALFNNFLSVVALVLLIYGLYWSIKRSGKDELKILAFYNIGIFFSHITLYVFTNMTYDDRYILQNFVFCLPVIAIALKTIWNYHDIMATKFCYMLMFISAVNVFVFYANDIKTDHNTEHKIIAKFLLEKKYTNGYATFWHGNILTELSNGTLEVWVLRNKNKKVEFNGIYRWLQKKEHERKVPQGKVFLLLTKQEIVATFGKVKIDNKYIISKTDNCILYGFESFNLMKKHLSSLKPLR